MTQQSREPEGAGDIGDLPPADLCDPVIEAYKKDVDRTLLRENLRRTPAERCRNFERNMAMIYELREAGHKLGKR